MARLNDAQVEGLLERLAEPAAAGVPDSTSHVDLARRKLSQLSASGGLGPMITQQLATYLNRPVRCASRDVVELTSERTMYCGCSQGVEYWFAIDSLLAACLADAMIGGEGDPSRVGLGSKAMRVAAAAAGQVFTVMAEVLDLVPPPTAEHVSAFKQKTPLGGGTLAVGSQSYHWQIGLNVRDTHQAAPLPHISGHAAQASMPVGAAARSREGAGVGLEASLENARAALERALRKVVTFDPPHIEQLSSPAMPQGWLRLGVPNHDGGAVILVADEPSGAALLNALLGTKVVDEQNPGVLAQTGAEALLLDMLHAFIASLPFAREETQRAMRLTDDAILASLPHHAIEHGFTIEGSKGLLRWLVPSQRLRTT